MVQTFLDDIPFENHLRPCNDHMEVASIHIVRNSRDPRYWLLKSIQYFILKLVLCYSLHHHYPKLSLTCISLCVSLIILRGRAAMVRAWKGERGRGGRSIAWHQGLKSAGWSQQGHGAGWGLQVMTVGVLGVKLLPWSDGHHVGTWDRSCCQCKPRGISRL